jgi:acyl-coenzyme A synthetase/AMP-(fatty) acid ligase
VTRSFEALLREAQVWESLFGERLGRAEVIGTVPHHFIYGAIFRILWPLWAGRPFDAQPFADGHALSVRLKKGGEFVLVSSPSLLQRMPAEEIRTLAGLRAIFTSGSLLEASVAKLWSFPIEVYGSTETGGIAWRRQEVADAPWTPLPGVKLTLKDDGTLHVRSPYVAPGGEQTADLVRFVGEGRFELLGRADRIAKVEGRRVSLAELESLAEAHPAVRRCVMLQSEPHARPQAVLVPEMASDVPDYGVVWEEVRRLILARYDAVVIPRRHRFVPVLPADARGKHPAEALRRLFTSEPSVGGTQSWPRFLGHRRQDGGVTIELAVPEDLPLFAGHFPGAPILPGVILISWAATCAEAYLGWRGDSRGIDHLKFNAAVWPRETLQLTLSLTPTGGVKFEFQAAGKAKAAGVFRPA